MSIPNSDFIAAAISEAFILRFLPRRIRTPSILLSGFPCPLSLVFLRAIAAPLVVSLGKLWRQCRYTLSQRQARSSLSGTDFSHATRIGVTADTGQLARHPEQPGNEWNDRQAAASITRTCRRSM